MKKLLLLIFPVLLNWTSTTAQSSLSFDGVNDEVIVPGAGSLIDGSNTWTIEFWYKSPTSGVPIAFSANTYFLVHPCGLLIFYTANGYIQSNCNALLLDNVAHHIAIRSNGANNGQIFVDGNPVSMAGNTHTGFGGLATASLSIGSNQGFTACTIDDVRIWNIARTNTEISTNMNVCLTGSESGLQLLHDFEGLIGNSTVFNKALTGATYDGVLTNMNPSTAYVAGLNTGICAVAEALSFDGVNDNVNLGNGITTSLSGGTKVSIEAWVKPTDLSNSGCIVGNYNTGVGQMQFLLRRNYNSDYQFWISDGPNSWHNTSSIATPTLNVWQHVAGTWDGNIVSIYVNGVLSGTTSPVMSALGNASNNSVWIGTNTINENFTGNVDEVRIWNVTRTQCEINTYKNCEIPTTATGLLANYHFNQGSASSPNGTETTLIDAAGVNTGTLSNFALIGTISNWIAPGGVVSGYTTTIAAPTVSVTSGAICAGQSFTMMPAGAVTFTYSSGSAVVSPIADATYSVSGTDANGCVSSNTAVSTVTVNALPTVSVNSLSICIGYAANLTANGASTYSWVSSSSSSGLSSTTGNMVTANSVTTTTTFSVTGTDANSCTNVATSTVVLNSLPTISVNSGTICAGQSFTMIPSGALTYSYTGGTAIVSPTTTSSYSVTGVDANGCVSSVDAVSSVTVNTLPTISAVTNNTLLCTGETATLTATGTTSYVWSTTETSMGIAVSPTATTVYTVTGTDGLGCSTTITIQQDVSLCTGIVTLSNNNELISVYPNPTNGLFTVELTTVSQVIVTNALGQVILTETFNAGKQNLDIHNEATGVYFIKVIENNKQQTIKVIKQ